MCCIDVVFTIFIIYVIGILVCMIQQGSFNHCPRRDLEARELYEDKCSPFPHNPDSDSPHPHRIIILSVAISCNNNNNNRVDIYGAVIMASHCESSPGSFDECRLSAKVAANPQTKPTDLDCESAGNGSYHPHPPSPFYYYSARELILILPSHGGWKSEST